MNIPLGQVVATPLALETIPRHEIISALDRHKAGDFGDLCEDDKTENYSAIISNERIFSSYHSSNNIKFYIITEADRSHTTILIPQEY